MTTTGSNSGSAHHDLVLVEVNGQTLSESQLNERIEAMLAQQPEELKPEQVPAAVAGLRASAVRDFITQVLLEGEALERGIAPSEEDVQKAMQDVTQRLPKGHTLEEALAQGGLSLEEFRKRLETELRIRALLDKELEKAPPASEEEARQFYHEQKEAMASPDTVTARHILVMSDKGDDAGAKKEKRAKIDGIRDQLLNGGDFAALAKSHSECPSGQEGGNLGSFGRGQMVKPFEEAAFSQAINAIGPVVETQFGYHLIQVTDKKSGAMRPFEEVRGQILEHLNRLHRQEIFQAIIDALQAKATILVDPSLEKEMEKLDE